MVEQVLQISVTPMQYELQVQNARLEYHQDFHPKSNMKQTQGVMEMKRTDGLMQLDTSEARKSLGYRTTQDLSDENAQKGKENIQDLTRSYVDMGKQLSQPGSSIPDIVRQRVLQDVQEASQKYTVFLPSSGAELSWQPGELDMNYREGQVQTDWDIGRAQLDYIPGSVRLNILEYAQVDIRYIGGPLYFPPSADPDYVEEAG